MNPKEWDEIFGISNEPTFSETPQFKHIVSFPTKGDTPGANSLEKLRLIMWFNSHNLDNHRDYVTGGWWDGSQSWQSFAFVDPNKAMLFKLSFMEIF
jgi:hypothetical protein